MKKLITSTTLVLAALCCTAQSYIEFTYDAAGNRTKREYFPPPPPEPNRDNDESINSDQVSQDEATGESEVSAASREVLTSSSDAISIYPNPTKSYIEINLGDNYNSEVSQTFDVLDVNGKIIQRFEISTQTSILKMSGYRSGMYYIQLRNNGLLLDSWKVIKIN